MPKIAGKFAAEINGKKIEFTKICSTYKTVDGPSGLGSRKVEKWEAVDTTESDALLATQVFFAFPRTNRARIVEAYETLLETGSTHLGILD